MKSKRLGKSKLWEQWIALLLVGAATVWADFSSAGEHQKGKKQINVSTIGLPFFPKEGDEATTNFVLYRIDSLDKSDRLLRRLTQRIETSARNQKQFDLLQRVLTVRNYGKEYVYIVVSPIAKGIKIEQPYRFERERGLFFDTAIDTKVKDQDFLYLRIYVVDKINDTLTKMIVHAGKRHELIWQEP